MSYFRYQRSLSERIAKVNTALIDRISEELGGNSIFQVAAFRGELSNSGSSIHGILDLLKAKGTNAFDYLLFLTATRRGNSLVFGYAIQQSSIILG